MDRVEKILRDEQVAGYVTLVSPTHSENRWYFPEWTVITITPEGIRFKAQRADFDSPEVQEKIVGDSVHVIFQLRDLAYIGLENMTRLEEMLSARIQIDHKPFHKFKPHEY